MKWLCRIGLAHLLERVKLGTVIAWTMLFGSYSKSAQHSLAVKPPLVQDNFPSTPGKVKMERNNYFGRVTNRWNSSSSSKLLFWAIVLVGLLAIFVFRFTAPVGHNVMHRRRNMIRTATRGGAA
eukprot:c22086_g3_i1 orf=3-371(-)